MLKFVILTTLFLTLTARADECRYAARIKSVMLKVDMEYDIVSSDNIVRAGLFAGKSWNGTEWDFKDKSYIEPLYVTDEKLNTWFESEGDILVLDQHVKNGKVDMYIDSFEDDDYEDDVILKQNISLNIATLSFSAIASRDMFYGEFDQWASYQINETNGAFKLAIYRSCK